MIKKLLIANRGEIACRIIRTAKALGIATVAVFSTVDEHALHVALADEAYLIGPAPARDSYLCVDKILTVAKHCAADAIHPGYGFLAENADFAARCQADAIIFVGPDPEAIEKMGSKAVAKQLMLAAGVPILPGYHGDKQGCRDLQTEAERIGYPVLLKATAGGGGKGMRLVKDTGSFEESYLAAKREAASSFGDDRLLVEKYLVKPRHIEIQVFADRHGNAVSLYERDCSIQRRHQKIVEEAPAPHFSDALRATMGQTAVNATKRIGYVGAGTFEFLVNDEGDYFFMEMNTRLQVEHAITEKITGLDLVAWQLRVAAGEPLPLEQSAIPLLGHAIELRLCAEDPSKQFLPSIGRIEHLSLPAPEPGLRIDSGIRAGDQITSYYDPMIAKIISYGKTRTETIAVAQRALAQYQLTGLTTNLGLLAEILKEPDYQRGDLTTHYLTDHATLIPALQCAPWPWLAFAALVEQHRIGATLDAANRPTHSPWQGTEAWQLNLPHRQCYQFILNDVTYSVSLTALGAQRFIINLDDGTSQQAQILGHQANSLQLLLDDQALDIKAYRCHTQMTLFCQGRQCNVQRARAQAGDGAMNSAADFSAPMPGTIVAINVAAGDNVETDAALITLEAMKMEHTLRAPSAGSITAVHFNVGDLVEEGVELLSFEPDAS